jgi:hypothetical protein
VNSVLSHLISISSKFGARKYHVRDIDFAYFYHFTVGFGNCSGKLILGTLG